MTVILSDQPLTAHHSDLLKKIPGVELRTMDLQSTAVERPFELIHDVQVLLCKSPPKNLDEMGELKLIQLASVGYEHLRRLGFADRDVRVCNARGLFDTAIAEWNIAMMINLTRDLRGMIRRQDAAHWERLDAFQQEIRGKVVGLWGYGGIGRETARIAKALGMTVHVLTRSGVKARLADWTPEGTGDPMGKLSDRAFTSGQESKFLSGLDFLILALPRTKATDGMVGERELQAMPRRAFVLNPARGPIIQEAALVRALSEGWIAGAALDTHYHYPLPADHPLWRFPNVIMTPHVSGADKSSLFPERLGELFTANLNRWLAGEPLWNEITKAEWREASV
jgi:phosphoglycerate dehydrogenase-like enzyme